MYNDKPFDALFNKANDDIQNHWRAPKFFVWPKKGLKSWICGNGQKLGAAPNFQH
jgi:hypothetical protein